MGTIPDKTVFDRDVADQMEETSRCWIERPVLILLEGGAVNRRQHIDQAEITIGRDPTNHIVLRDNRSSRRHTRLIYTNFDTPTEAPEVYIEDIGSTNGTFVNGIRINGRQLLSDRDKVLIGSTVFGFFLRDEAELEADQKLFTLASTDALTGLRNRGVFNMEIEKEVDRARRYGRELSLVLFDIDHFKHFNDTYGHPMGDAVLEGIGRLVKANIRLNDVGARYGGEEFAIILPETSLEGALIQAERLRVAVMNHGFREGTSVSISISLGIASVESNVKTADQLVKLADQALYQAKAEGRNCICWSQNGQIKTGTDLH